MLTLNSPQVVQETAARWKRDEKIAFVPTMGCLHEGHLSLVRMAKELGSRCIVSIFVNPLQFGPKEDFSSYPRTFEEDEEKLERLGVDLLFHPSVQDLYPPGFQTTVTTSALTKALCGKFRPGHFDGVATVCLKLFQLSLANFAVFGEKDFQQLRVVQQLTEDLNLPLSVVAHATVREADGLALSSRNRYLSPEERQQASAIPRALEEARRIAREESNPNVGRVIAAVGNLLETSGLRIQYVEVCPSRTLEPLPAEATLSEISSPRIFLAAHCGTTRLIDNSLLESSV